MEDAFWEAFKEIAKAQGLTLAKLAEKVDRERKGGNLSSAIRCFVLDYYKQQRDAAVEGERKTMDAWKNSMDMARNM